MIAVLGFIFLPDRLLRMADKQGNHLIKRNSAKTISKSYTISNYADCHPEYKISEPHDTIHLSVIDYYGNAILLTTAIDFFYF